MNQEIPAQRESGNAIIAGLVATLVPPVLVLVFEIATVDSPAEFMQQSSLFGIVYFLSLVGFAAFGLPTILILSYIGRLRIWTLMIAGTVEGGLIGYIGDLLFQGAHSPNESDINIFYVLRYAGVFSLVGLLVGLLVAGVYGVVAKIRFR